MVPQLYYFIMSIIKILLTITTLFLGASATQCDEYIKSLIESIDRGEYDKIPQAVLLYSGLAPNCPGQFIECQSVGNFSYYLSYQSPNFSINTNASSQDLLGYFTGLCVPDFCKKEDIQNFPLFSRSEVYGYDNNQMDIFGWVGIGFLITYMTVVLVATIVRSLKEQKLVEQPKRLSINEAEGDLNPSMAT